jgi:hypothetical protein
MRAVALPHPHYRMLVCAKDGRGNRREKADSPGAIHQGRIGGKEREVSPTQRWMCVRVRVWNKSTTTYAMNNW